MCVTEASQGRAFCWVTVRARVCVCVCVCLSGDLPGGCWHFVEWLHQWRSSKQAKTHQNEAGPSSDLLCRSHLPQLIKKETYTMRMINIYECCVQSVWVRVRKCACMWGCVCMYVGVRMHMGVLFFTNSGVWCGCSARRRRAR